MATARWMYERIEAIHPGHKKPGFNRWANDIRLMREVDGRTDQDIRELFGLANEDDFWQSNILSPKKLREKWDQLDLKLRRRNASSNCRGRAPVGPGQRHRPPDYGKPGTF